MRALENLPLAPSRRALLKGGLAGGFVLAFHLPLRAAPVNEPEQPPDSTAGQFAPNAFIRIDHAGKTTLVMPQVEMGQGVYTAVAMILADELDADYAQVVLEHAPPDDKLYGNPDFRHSGHRQFQFHSRVLEAAAHCRRGGAGDAGAGSGSAMAGRSGKLHRIQRQGHARGERADARLWRSGGCGERAAGAARSAAEGSERLHADRKAAQALRHARQDRRQGHLWHRRDAARDEIRNARAKPGIRRQSRTCRRQRGQDCPRRSASRRAGRSGRGRRRSHVGRQERSRRTCHHLGRRTKRADQFERHLGEFARRQQTGWRRRKIHRRRRQRLVAGRQSSTANTSCRSWRTRRWSR